MPFHLKLLLFHVFFEYVNWTNLSCYTCYLLINTGGVNENPAMSCCALTHCGLVCGTLLHPSVPEGKVGLSWRSLQD